MKEMIKQIAEMILKSEGMNILEYDESFIARSLDGKISGKRNSIQEYFSILKNNENERKFFLDSLQINYTEFFRNPLTFSILEKIVLPQIIMKKRKTGKKEIRVWSAACSSGQEAYSIAIILEEIRNIQNYGINYRIFATDRNENKIIDAQKGIYRHSELSNLSMKHVGKWFTKHGETYSVITELKEHIDFSVFDLLNRQLSCPAASIFGDFDLVICSNILFYYDKDSRRMILEKASGCMSENSFFIVDETEREILKDHKFREVFPQSAVFYPPQWRKKDEIKKF